jgi:chemotaxis protein CheD
VERIVVGMADCRVATDPQSALVTYALGSCLGLTVYDPVARIGGMLHYMLPDSSLDPAAGQWNPFKFADTGIPRLLEDVVELGASKQRLVICGAGAAQILDDNGVFDIGKRNYLAARRLLRKFGLLLMSEAVGGAAFRTVSLEIATGRVVVKEAGCYRELRPGALQKGEQAWHTAL